MSNRVVHFEIPSDNPEKCAGFFTEVFGWKFRQFGDSPYLLATTGDENELGINGAIMQKVGQGQPIINTISVENIDETMVHIENAGGKIVKLKRAIPTIGWLAFFADPDGNIHGVMQNYCEQGNEF